ncbi:hypothetical protein FVE89_16585 [Methylobacterium sp. 2A]|nr:hypothetical protein [Methylobacterium sp. 2A]
MKATASFRTVAPLSRLLLMQRAPIGPPFPAEGAGRARSRSDLPILDGRASRAGPASGRCAR